MENQLNDINGNKVDKMRLGVGLFLSFLILLLISGFGIILFSFAAMGTTSGKFSQSVSLFFSFFPPVIFLFLNNLLFFIIRNKDYRKGISIGNFFVLPMLYPLLLIGLVVIGNFLISLKIL